MARSKKGSKLFYRFIIDRLNLHFEEADFITQTCELLVTEATSTTVPRFHKIYFSNIILRLSLFKSFIKKNNELSKNEVFKF
jgi:hypothetical protein